MTDSFLPTLDTLTKGYQKGVEDLIATGIYDTKDDFTVVLQPFMKLMKPPLKVRDDQKRELIFLQNNTFYLIV